MMTTSPTLPVCLLGTASDAASIREFSEAITQAGLPVTSAMLPDGAEPAGGVSLPSDIGAIVLLISRAGVSSSALLAAAQRADALCASDSAHTLIPVFLESVPAAGSWGFLQNYTAVAGAFGSAASTRMLAEQVLQRLDASHQATVIMPSATGENLPLAQRPTVRDLGAAAAMGASAAGKLPASAPEPVKPSSEWAETAQVPASMMPQGAPAAKLPPMGRATPSSGETDEAKKRTVPVPFIAGGAALLLLLICGCVGLQFFRNHASADNANLSLTTPSPYSTDAPAIGVVTAVPSVTKTKTATVTRTVTGTVSPVDATATAGVLTPTSGSTSPVPSTTSTPIPQGTGLLGKYFNATFVGNYKPAPPFPTSAPVFTRIDPQVDFTWGIDSSDHEIVPGAGLSGAYAAQWTGWVQAPATGNYTFVSALSDDASNIWINGSALTLTKDVSCNSQVTASWTTHDACTFSTGSFAMTAGQKYPIRFEYYENGQGGAQVHLQWITPGSGIAAVIPQAVLYPAAS